MNKTTALILHIILFIAISMVYIYTHEQIHKLIMDSHGCTDIEIHYSVLDNYAQCNHYNERSLETYLNEELLHKLNEIFGYYMYMLITVLICLSMIHCEVKS